VKAAAMQTVPTGGTPSAMHAAVLRAPWQRRRNARQWPWMAATPLLLALPVGLMAWWTSMQPRILVAALGIVWLTWLWWMQVEGLLRQNRVLLARTVPGHASVLRQSLLLQAGLATLTAVGLLTLAVDMPLRWLWVVAPSIVMLTWLAREPWLWLAFGIGSPMLGEMRQASLYMTGLPLLQQLVALAALVALLATCVGQGGTLHRWSDARQERWQRSLRAMSEGRPAPTGAQSAVERALQRGFDWPLRRWRDRVLAAGAAAPVSTRLQLGLGTGGQWTQLAWIGVLAASLALAILAWVMHGYDVSIVQVADGGRIGLSIGLFAIACGTLHTRMGQLWARRREQALLVLLPGVPMRGDCRHLERQWRQEWLILWAVVTGTLLGLGSHGSEGTVSYVAACAAVNLPTIWLAQGLQRRLKRPPSMLVANIPPVMAAMILTAFSPISFPAWQSLSLGVLTYALLAAWNWKAAWQPLRLPLGRQT
jgi:hypothetical protein